MRPDALLTASPPDAWREIFANLWETFSAPLSAKHVESALMERERSIEPLELMLSGSAWELWRDFESTVPRTAPALVDFWNTTPGGKAVLILDGLSLRETPWLLQEAAARGYVVHQSVARGAEIPSETNMFARALGFAQRSALENNGAGGAHKLTGARTESGDTEWESATGWINAAPAIVLWHHWPDDRIHKYSAPGDGFQRLCREAAQQLTSESFWKMIERMTTGRRLVITSDHGYAACGQFADSTKDQSAWLKNIFGASRYAPGIVGEDNWMPPISLALETAHGQNQFALGRRKWKSAGGYPTLAHGGLSLLEVAVPFIEISKSK